MLFLAKRTRLSTFLNTAAYGETWQYKATTVWYNEMNGHVNFVVQRSPSKGMQAGSTQYFKPDELRVRLSRQITVVERFHTALGANAEIRKQVREDQSWILKELALNAWGLHKPHDLAPLVAAGVLAEK